MKTLLSWQRSLLVLPVLLLALGLLALACGDDEEEAVRTPAPEVVEQVVDVSLNEWSVEPSVGSVGAGAVTFSATNDGAIEHELVIIKTDLAPDALPVADARVDEAAAGEEIGEIEEFDPGLTIEGTFQLEPGAYALICNIPGHYEAGMFVEFSVE